MKQNHERNAFSFCFSFIEILISNSNDIMKKIFIVWVCSFLVSLLSLIYWCFFKIFKFSFCYSQFCSNFFAISLFFVFHISWKRSKSFFLISWYRIIINARIIIEKYILCCEYWRDTIENKRSYNTLIEMKTRTFLTMRVMIKNSFFMIFHCFNIFLFFKYRKNIK